MLVMHTCVHAMYLGTRECQYACVGTEDNIEDLVLSFIFLCIPRREFRWPGLKCKDPYMLVILFFHSTSLYLPKLRVSE